MLPGLDEQPAQAVRYVFSVRHVQPTTAAGYTRWLQPRQHEVVAPSTLAAASLQAFGQAGARSGWNLSRLSRAYRSCRMPY